MGRVIDRKAKATTAAEYVVAERHNARREALMDALSVVIRKATRNMTVTQLAEMLGCSRPQLSNLLNRGTSGRIRPWTLDMLVAASEAIGCPLSKLIAAAERTALGEEPDIELYMYNTEPRSKERLQKLVYEAVGYTGDEDERCYDELLEILYRVKDIEYANPEFCEGYYQGDISDTRALLLLREANKVACENTEDGPMPLWYALKKVLSN